MRIRRMFAILGPGILVAATGVGAGDLATAAFSGGELGTAILWAVVIGAGMKFVLNEGLARWQLATGDTLLEGVIGTFGRLVGLLFLFYFVFWTFLVAAALMSACGAAAHAIFPLFDDATTDKIFYGLLHSIAGIVLVRIGGYRLFEKAMGCCIAIMFVTVVVTAALLGPSVRELASGLLIPTIPRFSEGGMGWTVALIGGVGGTVTILCYGYWIREEGRNTPSEIRTCRIDLGVGYLMTAIFGVAMVIIGSTVPVSGRGVGLIVGIADNLDREIGTIGRWFFLLGAWGAVTSSLLGVWQSVPYLFADIWSLLGDPNPTSKRVVDVRSRPYRFYLYAMATVPAIGLWVGFARMQKAYAVIGALFLPMLAIALWILNGRHIASEFRNSFVTSILLGSILAFFLLFLGLVVF